MGSAVAAGSMACDRGERAPVCALMARAGKEIKPVPEIKWNIDFTQFDIIRRRVKAGFDTKLKRNQWMATSIESPDKFYTTLHDMMHKFLDALSEKEKESQFGSQMIQEMEEFTEYSNVQLPMEWLYVKMGRPRWFVEKSLLDLLSTCQLDSNWTGVNFTHDVFTLVFEEGSQVAGFPLHWIRVFRPRSALSRRLFQQVNECVDGTPQSDFQLWMSLYKEELHPTTTTSFQVCLGVGMSMGSMGISDSGWLDTILSPKGQLVFTVVKKDTGEYLCDRFLGQFVHAAWVRNSFNGKDFSWDSGPGEDIWRAVLACSRISAAAMLYHHARPELLVSHSLPRSQRFHVLGERDSISRLLLPKKLGTPKLISPASDKDKGVSSIKSPHYRGYVLAVLRDQRFKRKADGSFQTSLRQPCAIHPELMEECP